MMGASRTVGGDSGGEDNRIRKSAHGAPDFDVARVPKKSHDKMHLTFYARCSVTSFEVLFFFAERTGSPAHTLLPHSIRHSGKTAGQFAALHPTWRMLFGLLKT